MSDRIVGSGVREGPLMVRVTDSFAPTRLREGTKPERRGPS